MTAKREKGLYTQGDVSKALKAAKAAGFNRVEVIASPDGLRIVCEVQARAEQLEPDKVESLV